MIAFVVGASCGIGLELVRQYMDVADPANQSAHFLLLYPG